ncbi:MAG: hypothetical protein J7L34_01435 [Thermotogaceae bacterium]|nr:hypothetical protein [Thermotogaceae bacterium]
MSNVKSKVKQKNLSIEKLKEVVDVSLFGITVYIVSILFLSALVVTFGVKTYDLSVENRWLRSQIKEMKFTLNNLEEDYYNLASQIQSIDLDEK